MTQKVTKDMLKRIIEESMEIIPRIPEHDPLPIKEEELIQHNDSKAARNLSEIPKAWDKDSSNVIIDMESFDWRSEEEIFKEQVIQKWNRFKKTLSQREQSVLKTLLGLDVKRYSVEELERLQGALKGKLPK